MMAETTAALGDAWGKCGDAERDYEQALPRHSYVAGVRARARARVCDLAR